MKVKHVRLLPRKDPVEALDIRRTTLYLQACHTTSTGFEILNRVY